MQAELQAERLAKDGKGTRFKPGQNYYTIKRDRIAAKLNELVAEYFPNGDYSPHGRQPFEPCGQALCHRRNVPRSHCGPTCD